MCFRKSSGLLVFFVCLVLSQPVFALMLGLTTEKLTHSAALIVTGEVEDVASQWTADRTVITSTAVVTVHQVIKGRLAERTVRVMYMGGEVGDLAMRQSDVAPLHKGERVVLFLSPEEQFSSGTAYRMQGRAQGKYTIGDDYIARKQGFSVLGGAAQMDSALPVEVLLKKIRSYVDEE